MSTFEKSKQYLDALEAYRKETFSVLYNPINVIVASYGYSFDHVFLFYPQDKVQDIFKLIETDWENRNDNKFEGTGLHLGCDKPEIKEKIFMGAKYKAIALWYDGQQEDIPKEFLNKI